MIDTEVKLVPYARLILFTILLGIVSAGVTFAFMSLTHLGAHVLWVQAPAVLGVDPRLFTVLVCSVGGLLVGLLVKAFGDHTGIFAEIMREFGKTGRFDYRTAPGIVLTAFVSLVAGASLGPEAPLADACGGLGTWLADRLKLNDQETRTLGYSGVSGMLAAFITSPFGGALLGIESAQGAAGSLQTYFWVLFPSLLSSAVAAVVFVWLSGDLFETLYQFPGYVPQLADLLYAVPLGLAGGIVGILFMRSLRALQQLFAPMKQHLVLRGLIGGVAMGIVGALLPLTLFSGEAAMVDLIAQAAKLGVVTLIVLGVVKVLITALLLATGWKGGYIFPIMFGSVAVGLAANLLFPAVPVAVAVAATMTGALVASMRAPLFAALFTLTLVQRETAPDIAVAIVASGLLTVVLSAHSARRAANQSGPVSASG